MIELPWPSPALSPNARSRTHWKATSAKKRARADAIVATKAAKACAPAGDGPLDVLITFQPPCRRARDVDNLLAAMKASLDGIAEALGVNDSRFRPRVMIGPVVKGGNVIVEVMAG